MGIPALPKTWNANDVLRAADLNGDFTTIRDHYNANAVELSGAQTITGIKTFSAVPVFSVGVTISTVGLTISAGGFTVTGNSTLTGTLGGLTGLTVASGGITVTGNSTITGTLGGLTGLTVASGTLTMSGGAAIAKRVDNGDSGTADTIDWSTGNVQRSRLTGNCTYTFSNMAVGESGVLEVLQDGTGSRLATWPAGVVWDNGVTPTLTTTINRKDLFVFLCVATNTYIGTTMAQNVANTT